MSTAKQTYETKLADWQAVSARLARVHGRIGWWRAAAFGAALLLGILAWREAGIALALGSLGSFAAFLGLAVWDARLGPQREKARLACEEYGGWLRRLAGQLHGRPTGLTHLPGHHLFALDLDIVGEHSLFQRLCNAQTPMGQTQLAHILLTVSDLETIRARQVAVRELAPDLALREQLALSGLGNAAERLHPDELIAWAEAPAPSAPGFIAPTVFVLSAVAVIAVIGWAVGAWSGAVAVVVAACQWIFSSWATRFVVARASDERQSEALAVVGQLLHHFERSSYRAHGLTALQASLAGSGGAPASTRIRGLARILTWAEADRNQLFAPIAILLMWRLQFGLALDRWRRANGGLVREWLRGLGELEALMSLAGYAFEMPNNVEPTFDVHGPVFRGTGLKHPLMPAERCIANDVELDEKTPLWVVSGSNMSGKSTLMRTIGCNAVLAYAGAPVCATSLHLSHFHIGATLRVQDSLAEGASRFYAEIERLAALMKLAKAEQGGLLFLIDEILSGTNSHDRQRGAQALLAAFVQHGAIGLVTTHDLAIARAAEGLAPKARNVHLADTLEAGRLVFDYQLRPGIVDHSNAVELMRALGLEV